MCWTLWATVVNRGLVGSLKFGNCTPCSSRKRLTGSRRLFSNEICVDYWDFRMYWNVFDASSKLERFRCIFLIFRYHTSEILFKNSNIWMDCTHCKSPQSNISYGVILVDVCVNQIKQNLAKKKCRMFLRRRFFSLPYFVLIYPKSLDKTFTALWALGINDLFLFVVMLVNISAILQPLTWP